MPRLLTRPVTWDGSAAGGATRPPRSALREQIPIAVSELADQYLMRRVTRASSSSPSHPRRPWSIPRFPHCDHGSMGDGDEPLKAFPRYKSAGHGIRASFIVPLRFVATARPTSGQAPICGRAVALLRNRKFADGEEWIRTIGSAILIMLRKTGLSETDQCTTEQGVGRVPAYPALSSRPPIDSNSVTSGLAEFDPVLRAPLPQSRLLGLAREIVPPFEGAPPHQQILISAVSTSSAKDVANFVVVVG